jgi:hypothetical protein
MKMNKNYTQCIKIIAETVVNSRVVAPACAEASAGRRFNL